MFGGICVWWCICDEIDHSDCVREPKDGSASVVERWKFEGLYSLNESAHILRSLSDVHALRHEQQRLHQ